MAKSNFAKESFSSLPSWAKGVISVAVVGGIIYAVYKLSKNFNPEQQRNDQEKQEIETELQKEVKKKPLTYPLSQYKSFADQIEVAGFGLGTDEEAIYSIFRKLKNNADYLALKQAWGKPTRKTYDWAVPLDYTLSQFLRYELSDSEITKLNNILQSKGITYRV
jgi:hypothetical protein